MLAIFRHVSSTRVLHTSEHSFRGEGLWVLNHDCTHNLSAERGQSSDKARRGNLVGMASLQRHRPRLSMVLYTGQMR